MADTDSKTRLIHRPSEFEDRLKISKPQPPIFKLHQELLWYIFVLNSYADINLDTGTNDPRHYHEMVGYIVWPTESDALDINRHTSQVCSRWRALILKSPSVWANSLDLHSLNQKEDHWRKEVLKRSGNAPLTVIGELDPEFRLGSSFYSTPFFLKVLEENWERLRTLRIRCSDKPTYDRIRPLLRRSAPKLEEFTLHCLRGATDITEHFIPFSDCAPRLNSFLNEANDFRFSGPCFHNLRSFWLKSSTEVFTPTEILQGIQQMPLLETLFFEDLWCLEPFDKPTQVMELRHLKSITAFDSEEAESIGAILNVVPYIKDGRGCELTVRKAEGFEDHSKIARAISTFLKENLFPDDVKTMHYSLNKSKYAPCANLAVVFSGPHPDTPIQLSVIFLIPEKDYDIFYSMAKYLSRLKLWNVMRLHFHVKRVEITALSRDERSMWRVVKLLQALRYVEELHSDNESLRFLRNADELSQTRINLISNLPVTTLPSLTFLRVRVYDESTVTAYCWQRYTMGVPLKYVHVKEGKSVYPSQAGGGLDMSISWPEMEKMLVNRGEQDSSSPDSSWRPEMAVFSGPV